MRSACSASIVSCAFSTSATMSPMPRMRPAMRSGSKVSSASIFSPRPTKRIGLPVICTHRKRRTAASVAVHPGQNHAGDADLVVEFGGDVHGVLTGQAIDHQQRFARFGDVAHGGGLRDQLGVDVQAGRRCRAYRRRSRRGWPGSWRASRSRPGLRPSRWAGYRRRSARRGSPAAPSRRGGWCRARPSARFLPSRSFRRLASLAVVVVLPEPCRPTIRIGAGGLSILSAPGSSSPRRTCDQFVMDDLDDLLAGGDGFGDGLRRWPSSATALTKSRATGSETSASSSATRTSRSAVRDVILGQRALLGEAVEDAGEAFGQVLKHGRRPFSDVGMPLEGRGRSPTAQVPMPNEMPPWAKLADGGRSYERARDREAMAFRLLRAG